MRPLGFWKALGASSTRATSKPFWKILLGDAYKNSERFLVPTGGMECSYPCPNPTSADCPRRIVVHGPGDLVAICDSEESCGTVTLDDDDIRLLKIDLPRVASVIASVLGLRGSPRLYFSSRTTWLLGQFSVRLGERIPVYLLLAPSSGMMLGELLSIGRQARERYILLTPDDASIDAACDDLIQADNHCTHLLLPDLIGWESDGSMRCRAPLEQALPRRIESGSAGENIFCRRGKAWEISYRGRPIMIDHSLGMSYLAALLQESGTEIHCLDLRDLGESKSELRGERLVGEMVLEDADEQALEEYRDALNDDALSDEHREWIRLQLAAAEGKDGKPRKSSPKTEKARINVRVAIIRAFKKIEESDRELADHLRQCIKTGNFSSYLSEESWVVEL